MEVKPPFVVEAKESFPKFALNCLVIRTKEQGNKPLVMNKAQQYIHDRIEEQLERIGKVRAILLKGRQQGASTYVEGRFIWKTTMRGGVSAFILTHDSSSTDALFTMTKRYYDNLPRHTVNGHCHDFKPTLKKSNAKELIFSELDSGYKIGTAGNKAIGVGTTQQYFHGSEVALWTNAGDQARGVMQSVPKSDWSGSEIILESTARGVGNYFHQQWVNAEQGKSEYIAIFVPWYWQPEYTATVPTDFVRTMEEDELHEEFGLTDGQLQWRRITIMELSVDGLSGEKVFKAEYPNTSAEAFVSTGEDGLITADIVWQARNNNVKASGAFIVGVDPSRGKDKFSWTKRANRRMWGTGSRTFGDYKLGDGVALCKNLLDTVDPEIGKKPDFMFVDAGYGADIVDRLHELGYFNVKAIWFGAGALNPIRYFNKRSEMWGEMNKWLRDEHLPVQVTNTDSLQADLTSSLYGMTSKDQIQLLGKDKIKKKLGYSPDEGDSAALTFAESVVSNVGAQVYNQHTANTDYDVLG